MDDEERIIWVRNDYNLYQSWKSSRLGIYQYVKENRKEITDYINKKLNPEEESGWKHNTYNI